MGPHALKSQHKHNGECISHTSEAVHTSTSANVWCYNLNLTENADCANYYQGPFLNGAEYSLCASGSSGGCKGDGATRKDTPEQVAAAAGKPLCSSVGLPGAGACTRTYQYCYQLGVTSDTCGNYYRQTQDGNYKMCKWVNNHCSLKGKKTSDPPSCA